MTIFKDSYDFSRTLGDVRWQSFKTSIASVELVRPPQKHHHTNTTTPAQKTPPQAQKHHHTHTPPHKHHHKNTTTRTPPQKHHHKNTHTQTAPHKHHTNTTTQTPLHLIAPQLSKTFISPQFLNVVRSSLVKNAHFATVLSIRHARNNERVARRRETCVFYHSFERSTRTK